MINREKNSVHDLLSQLLDHLAKKRKTTNENTRRKIDLAMIAIYHFAGIEEINADQLSLDKNILYKKLKEYAENNHTKTAINDLVTSLSDALGSDISSDPILTDIKKRLLKAEEHTQHNKNLHLFKPEVKNALEISGVFNLTPEDRVNLGATSRFANELYIHDEWYWKTECKKHHFSHRKGEENLKYQELFNKRASICFYGMIAERMSEEITLDEYIENRFCDSTNSNIGLAFTQNEIKVLSEELNHHDVGRKMLSISLARGEPVFAKIVGLTREQIQNGTLIQSSQDPELLAKHIVAFCTRGESPITINVRFNPEKKCFDILGKELKHNSNNRERPSHS